MDDPFDDPLPSGKFLFEVDGVEIGRFTEVSGLSVEVAVETIEEGGENGFVHKVPGRMSWPNVVLKQGVTRGDALFKWLEKSSGEGFAGQGNKLDRRAAAVVLLALDGAALRRWTLTDAFAVKWTGPSFSTNSTEPASEELEIAHHGFRPSDG